MDCARHRKVMGKTRKWVSDKKFHIDGILPFMGSEMLGLRESLFAVSDRAGIAESFTTDRIH